MSTSLLVSSPASLILIPLLFLLIPSTFGYILLSSSLRDLERTNDGFILETTSWTASRIRSGQNIYTNCSGTLLLGGYGVLGATLQADDFYSRSYSDLPSHTMIYFTFNFWAIDSWNGSPDYFLVQFDLKTLTGWNTFPSYTSFPSNICGDTYKDLSNVRIFGRVGHIGPTLTFKVVSKLDQISTNEAIGIRDLNLHFVDNPPVTSETMCARAPLSIGAGDCTCIEGQYESLPGVCSMCDYSCTSCFGSGPNQCYECKSGYSFDGTKCIQCYNTCGDCSGPNANQCKSCQYGYVLFQNSTCVPATQCTTPLTLTGSGRFCETPCSDLTKFAYWDGRCLSTCDAPLKKSLMINAVKACHYPCLTTEFLYWDGTCGSSCSSTLYDPRLDGTTQFCDFPCAEKEYLYWNKTCSSVCNAPLRIRKQGDRSLCEYPCTVPSEYLYWDGTCSISCDPTVLTVRTEGTNNFCDYPCEINEYRYYNGTCLPKCVTPLLQRVVGNRNFCDYKCTGTQYLHLDGTCSGSCNPPYSKRTTNAKNFCEKPCPLGQFLNWDNDCVVLCELPLVQQIKSTIDICHYPCTGASDYLYADGTCSADCKTPFEPAVRLGKNFCDRFCAEGEYELLNGTCITSCEFPMSVQTNDMGTYCILPCEDDSQYYHEDTQICDNECRTSVIFEKGLYLKCFAASNDTMKFPIVRMVQYIRYLDVNIPLKLEKTTASRGNNILSLRFSPGTFQNLRNKFPNLPLPQAFQKPGLSSSFLANFIDDLILLGILVSCELLRTGLEALFRVIEYECLADSARKLKVLTRWNLPLIFIATNTGDIFFFSLIEFRTFDISYSGAMASLGVCITMLIAAVAFVVCTGLIARKADAAKVRGIKDPIYTNFVAKWKSFQVLFGGNEEESGLNPSFFFIYCIRQSVPMIIAASLYSVPLLQVISYVLVSCGTLFYIIFKNPVKKTIDHINLVVIESAILVVNVGVLIFVILEKNGDLNSSTGDVVEKIVIIANYVITFAAIVFLAMKILLITNDATRLRSEAKAQQEKSILMQLIFVPFQQGGFGFEQVQMDGSFYQKSKDAINKKENEENKLFSPTTIEENFTTEIVLDSSDTPKVGKSRPQKALEMMEQNTKVSLPNETLETITQEEDFSAMRKKRIQNLLKRSQGIQSE